VKSYAEAPRLPAPSQAQALFQSKCVACHTTGKGHQVGPDLAAVTSRRDRGWLARWLANPDKLLVEKDPVAIELFAKHQKLPMPDLNLNEQEVAALISYMDSRSRDREPEPRTGHDSRPDPDGSQSGRAAVPRRGPIDLAQACRRALVTGAAARDCAPHEPGRASPRRRSTR